MTILFQHPDNMVPVSFRNNTIYVTSEIFLRLQAKRIMRIANGKRYKFGAAVCDQFAIEGKVLTSNGQINVMELRAIMIGGEPQEAAKLWGPNWATPRSNELQSEDKLL